MNTTDDFIGGLRRGEMASDHFTIVANSAARDPRLSCGAKGLFLNMISHRKGFRITEEFLASQCTDGVQKIRRLLTELRAAGYVYRSETRSRYPAGTKNAKGKDISGALGPYTWFVTDKPEEIAVILDRYGKEQRAANLTDGETAGHDYVSNEEVVPNCGDDGPPDGPEGESLPPKLTGSDDQGKPGETAGRDYLRKPTVGFRSSKEDQPKKTIDLEEQEPGAAPAPDPSRHDQPQAAGRTEGELSLITGPATDSGCEGDPLTARVASENHLLDEEVLSQSEALLAIQRTLSETTRKPRNSRSDRRSATKIA